MSSGHVHYRGVILAPAADVFRRLSDHESMSLWPLITSCKLIQTGVDRNGLGAVRRVGALGLTLDEAIVAWDPPRMYEYTIVKGLPVEHLGRVTVTEIDGGTEVQWEVWMTSRLPGVARITAALLGWGLPQALLHIRTSLEGCGTTFSNPKN